MLISRLVLHAQVCTSMAVSWVGYISAMQQRVPTTSSSSASSAAVTADDILVELAVQVRVIPLSKRSWSNPPSCMLENSTSWEVNPPTTPFL